jgi:DNA-binding beta-propeller fold protein YncE
MKKTIIPLIVAAFAISFASARAASWTVTGSIPLGGEGGWDYATMDTPGQRLFVTHGDHILVVDLKTKQVVGSLDSSGAHGVALARDFKRGFFTNGNSGLVTIFDLQSLKPLQTVTVGQHPDAICYEPVTRRVFAFNGVSKTASVIDAATGNVAGEIPLPGKPEFAGADGRGFVYDNIEDKGLVVKIDAAKMAIVAKWQLPPGNEPSALAVDADRHRLFSGCGSKKLFVLDSDTGAIVATLPIGGGIDADAYDPVQQHVFASCGDGTLTVIKQSSADSYAVAAVVPTEKGARTMAFDSATQSAYLPDAKFGPAPAPTTEHPHPRPSIVPGTLKLLVVRQAP